MDLFEEMSRKAFNALKENDIVELGKAMIRIPSLTGEETPLAEFLLDYMKQAGLDVEMQNVDSKRSQPRGVIHGTGEGPSLLINGHLDMAPPLYGVVDPFTPIVKDGVLWGTGLANTKGGLTAGISAVAAIAKAGIELKGDLILNPVVGELQGGHGIRWLMKHRPLPDAWITSHTAYPIRRPYIRHVGVGTTGLAITTYGRSVHAPIKETGVDAIQKMCMVMDALSEMDKKKKWTYEGDPAMPNCPMIAVGSIIGGRGESHELRGANELADHCTIITDVRYNRYQSPESVKKDVEAVLDQLKKVEPDFKYSIQLPPLPYENLIYSFPPSPAELTDEEWLIKTLQRYHEEVWKEPIECKVSYAGSDTAVIAEAGVPAFGYYNCELLRRPTDGFHGVQISELVKGAKTLILTALDMCTKTKEEYDRLRTLRPKKNR